MSSRPSGPTRPVVTVVVAHDRPLVRLGSAAVLHTAPGVVVLGAAADGVELLGLLAETQPHVVVLDLRLPLLDGVAVTVAVRARYPGSRVLLLTDGDEEEDGLLEALRAGASGYVLGDVEPAALVEAVRVVAAGSLIVGAALRNRLLSGTANRSFA